MNILLLKKVAYRALQDGEIFDELVDTMSNDSRLARSRESVQNELLELREQLEKESRPIGEVSLELAKAIMNGDI